MSTATNPDASCPDWIADSLGRDRTAESRPGEPILRAYEERLVAEAANGSENAFRDLIELHQDRVFGFCLRWSSSPEDAEEVCQDAFVRAFHALPRFRARARFSTWVYRIALNLCRDRARSRQHRNSGLTCSIDSLKAGDASLTCGDPKPDENRYRAENFLKLREGIESLPPRLREAILLHVVEGLSHEDCAAVLGCSRRAAEGRLYRARRRLLAWWALTEESEDR
ncbi:MAG: RNA polymerase sigma factor [Verrucomicrobiales bacterium]